MELNVTDSARFDVARSNAIWETYVNLLQHCGHVRYSEEFLTKKFHLGLLHGDLAYQLNLAVTRAPTIQYDAQHGYAGALLSEVTDELQSKINSQHLWCSDSEELRAAISSALAALTVPVSQVLGGPWRLLTYKSWSTPSLADVSGAEKDFGNTAWHTDGMPFGIFKIMIYTTALGPGLGGIELKADNGEVTALTTPAGAWLLFFNSHLWHRAVAPTIPNTTRRVIELTICPWHQMVLTPVHLGLNARQPIYPI